MTNNLLKAKVAEYECGCGCRWEWRKQHLGPPPACPRCGSLYFKWTNYEKDFVR